MTLKHPMFFSAEIAAINPPTDDSSNASEGFTAGPARYLAPPIEVTVTHGEGLVLMDDLEALTLTLSSDEEKSPKLIN